MPIYEFICQDCQAEVELLVRSQDKPECPKCQSKRLERQLSVISSPTTSGSQSQPESCGLPRCCGGGCGPI